jgi:hypothetical protein
MMEKAFPPHERELLVYRIICGYLRYKDINKDIVLKIRSPSNKIKYEAQEIYVDYYNKAKEQGIEEDYSYLSGWDYSDDKRLEEIREDIDNLKIDLYYAIDKNSQVDRIRAELNYNNKLYDGMFQQKHRYNSLTCDGIAAYAKKMYILEKCTYFNKKLYDWTEIPITKLFNYYNESIVTEEEFRAIVKSEPWASYWKTKPKFPNPTEEQKFLLLWSNQYDRIYSSPDCPSETVIEDDDALDGWMLVQKKKRKEEQNKTEAERKITSEKIGQAGEVFIFAENEKEAEKIESLNSMESKIKKQIRISEIKKKGAVDEAMMPDVIQENQAKINQEFYRRTRNK